MFTNAKSKILFAGWTWVTLGSNKLKEKSNLWWKATCSYYRTKTVWFIVKCGQQFLLIWSTQVKIQCDTANEFKYRQTFNLFLLLISRWLSVSTLESSAVAIVKIHDLFSNYYKGKVGENSEMHNHRSQTLRPDATASDKTQKNKQIYQQWN